MEKIIILNNNHVYYFGQDGSRYIDLFCNNWGSTCYFGAEGAWLTNHFYSNWSNTYYFGGANSWFHGVNSKTSIMANVH